MSQTWVLGQRSLWEAARAPELLLPTFFIPLFFLVVNVGQAGKIFPSGSIMGFLHGQSCAAFQLPSSLLLAASFGPAALYLVEDIEGGYFDKLRAAPVSRTAIVLGRLDAEVAKSVPITGLRSLILEDLAWAPIARGFAVVIAAGVVMLTTEGNQFAPYCHILRKGCERQTHVALSAKLVTSLGLWCLASQPTVSLQPGLSRV